MAAAIEAMADMGFPKKLVRQKVNQLLKIYTKDGWRLIEDGAYSVLLEALLEDQTNGDDDGDASPKKSSCRKHAEYLGAGPSSSKDVCPNNDARGGNEAEASVAGPSSSKVASVENDASGGSDSETAVPVPSLSKFFLPCSNLEAVNGTLQSEDVLDSASDNRPLNCTSLTQMPDANYCLLPTEGERKGWQETPVTHSVQQLDTLPTRRRRPYHGWVGRDDDDFVEQTEAPLPEVLRKMFVMTVESGKRKRKRMWDVKPENM